MKKVCMGFAFAILALLCGCGINETSYSGLNAEIVSIDVKNQTICVKDTTNSDNVFGNTCTINCAGSEIIYVDFDTKNIKDISLADLKPGDEITLDLSKKEYNKIQKGFVNANQLQLQTQR